MLEITRETTLEDLRPFASEQVRLKSFGGPEIEGKLWKFEKDGSKLILHISGVDFPDTVYQYDEDTWRLFEEGKGIYEKADTISLIE